jgi:hypothetical protein
MDEDEDWFRPAGKQRTRRGSGRCRSGRSRRRLRARLALFEAAGFLAHCGLPDRRARAPGRRGFQARFISTASPSWQSAGCGHSSDFSPDCRALAAAELALRLPVLTARTLAERLQVTHRAALGLIRDLLAGGVLREATGGRAWRAFVLA